MFYLQDTQLQLAFVSSKKVGNAVIRNRARRVLRALALENEKSLKTGKYIFVAKGELLNRSHQALKKDFKYAMKKLGLSQ